MAVQPRSASRSSWRRRICRGDGATGVPSCHSRSQSTSAVPSSHGLAPQRREVGAEHEVAVAAVPARHLEARLRRHVDVDAEQVVAALGAVLGDLAHEGGASRRLPCSRPCMSVIAITTVSMRPASTSARSSSSVSIGRAYPTPSSAEHPRAVAQDRHGAALRVHPVDLELGRADHHVGVHVGAVDAGARRARRRRAPGGAVDDLRRAEAPRDVARGVLVEQRLQEQQAGLRDRRVAVDQGDLAQAAARWGRPPSRRARAPRPRRPAPRTQRPPRNVSSRPRTMAPPRLNGIVVRTWPSVRRASGVV